MLLGLGHFAGGLAQGYAQGRRVSREDERARREEEEYRRQQDVRLAARNTLGNVGQTREDGSVYDFQTALGDFSAQVAPHDPNAAINARVQEKQLEAAELGLKRGRRQDEYEQREADVFSFLQRYNNAPDEVFYREAAKFASRYGNDGKSFGIDFDANTGYSAVMVDANTGQVFRQPIGSRQEVVQQLIQYASPRMYSEGQRLGLETRKVGAQERTARAAETTAEANSMYRRDQLPVLQAQADMYRAHAGTYDAMTNYYNRGGPGSNSTALRLPEGDRIALTSLERQAAQLIDDMRNPDNQDQAPLMRRQLVDIRNRMFDILSRNGGVPQNMSRWQFVGHPPPLEAAKRIMTVTGNNELAFRAAVEDFDLKYGDSPDAAQARNALQAYEDLKFNGQVRPQSNAPGAGLGVPSNPAAFQAGQSVRRGLDAASSFVERYHPFFAIPRAIDSAAGSIRGAAGSFARGLAAPQERTR